MQDSLIVHQTPQFTTYLSTTIIEFFIISWFAARGLLLIAAVLALTDSGNQQWMLINGPGVISSCPTAPGGVQCCFSIWRRQGCTTADTISGISAVVRDQVFCLFSLVTKSVASCWLLHFPAPVAERLVVFLLCVVFVGVVLVAFVRSFLVFNWTFFWRLVPGIVLTGTLAGALLQATWHVLASVHEHLP